MGLVTARRLSPRLNERLSAWLSARPSRTAGAHVGLVALCVLATPPSTARAEPWAAPGDVRLRHDLQQLSDQGLLTGPSLSWPIAWSHVARQLENIDATALSPGQRAAAERLRTRAAQEMRPRNLVVTTRIAAAADPSQLRTFEYLPREEGEATLTADWLGDRFAWKLAVTAVADPDDDRAVRPDGSYLAMSLGNWMASAGYLERWWGPGWQGSLILSTNARPMPAIALDRNEPKPFDVPVLRWLGPWRLSTFMGQLESDRDYSHALLFGLRTEIRPHPTLQIAASRTAQWCGDGRPCGLDTFWDLLTGDDNDEDLSQQPGNQLAGFDVRWSWPGSRVPLALYAQAIGEDEAGFMPAKYLGLFGTEIWGDLGDGSWRAHVEYADTACDFLNSPPIYGCAYTNVIYTSGYRYRGRAIGHTMDADGESIGGGAMLIDSRGHRWELLGRNIKLNRAGVAPGHSLGAGAAKVQDVAVTHERAYAWGNITLSVGYSDVESGEDVLLEDGLRGFLTWRHQLR
jgi:hypothetical protein